MKGDTYEKMVDQLYKELPEKAKTHERFKVPQVESFIEGKKTMVKGFGALLKELRRPEKDFLKFLTKETAVPAVAEKDRIIISGKFSNAQVNKIVENYFKIFVICPECGKPDTKVEDRGHIKMMRCEACGALNPIKNV